MNSVKAIFQCFVPSIVLVPHLGGLTLQKENLMLGNDEQEDYLYSKKKKRPPPQHNRSLQGDFISKGECTGVVLQCMVLSSICMAKLHNVLNSSTLALTKQISGAP
jgi:hypothetical protein